MNFYTVTEPVNVCVSWNIFLKWLPLKINVSEPRGWLHPERKRCGGEMTGINMESLTKDLEAIRLHLYYLPFNKLNQLWSLWMLQVQGR